MVKYTTKFKIEPLGGEHDRAAFSCESQAQTEYFRKTARQHDDKGMAAVYVLVEIESGRVAGYYTLSMHSIDAGELPPEVLKTQKLPKSGDLPAALIGRLARDITFKGQGLGPLLAYDALKRVRDAKELVGCVAIVVDPDGDEATRFWIDKIGFFPLLDQTRLFIAMATVQKLP